jgi:hypothetical protein
MSQQEALNEARNIGKIVHGWQDHCLNAGITENVVAMYSQQIDRNFLLSQRKALLN